MESDKTSRFSASDKQKACYEEAAVNKNTKKSTETWLRTFLEWANEKKKPKSIESLSPEDLDEVLGDFYTELKKKDGSDYEPESLGVMQASLDRYLKNKGYTVSIIRGREFANSKGEHCTVPCNQQQAKIQHLVQAQRMGQGKIGKIMQSIVEGTSVEESNKRVAGHMPRKTLVRKLDQLGYSRDEISAVTGHSNIKSLDHE